MDMMTAIFAANMAKRELAESGGVGYTEATKTVLLDGTFEAAQEGDMPPNFETEVLDIKPGGQLSVNWNGKQYTCVVFDIADNICFGNLSIADAGDDTGEPFLYSLGVSEDNVWGIFATTIPGTVTVTVVGETETVHPIDQKYLPDDTKPKVIDLDKYGIGEAIVGLAESGGGSQKMERTENISKFFADINTDREPRLKMSFDVYTITVDQCFRASMNGQVVQIGYSFLFFLGNSTTQVSVAIIDGIDEITVIVNVT